MERKTELESTLETESELKTKPELDLKPEQPKLELVRSARKRLGMAMQHSPKPCGYSIQYVFAIKK